MFLVFFGKALAPASKAVAASAALGSIIVEEETLEAFSIGVE